MVGVTSRRLGGRGNDDRRVSGAGDSSSNHNGSHSSNGVPVMACS